MRHQNSITEEWIDHPYSTELLYFLISLIPPILMKHKLILCLVCCLLLTRTAHAQWIVTDPVNLAGNIANTIKEIPQASWCLWKFRSTYAIARKQLVQ